MLNACVRNRSDHTPCRLLLYRRCYLALRDISFSKQEVAEHVIRHPNVMRQNCRPKTKLGITVTQRCAMKTSCSHSSKRGFIMKKFDLRSLISAIAVTVMLISSPPSAMAGEKITKTFSSAARPSRVDACTSAKDSAQRWAEDESRKTLAIAITEGRRWTAQIDGYSQCDCDSEKNAFGANEWKCSVDATIRSKT